MSSYTIRTYGDPVLRQAAAEVTEIDGKLVRLCNDMLTTMYEAPGLGLAAPQVGVQKRLFVYDVAEEDHDPHVLINPRIVESSGEFAYSEGCLSVPGLYFDIVRPDIVHVVGLDLDGNEVSIEADGLLGRLMQHELDHLDGRLLLEYLDDDQRAEAMRVLRQRQLDAEAAAAAAAKAGGVKRKLLRLP